MDVMREVLEHLNAYRFALNSALLLIVGRYLWQSRRALYRESTALAMALALFIAGDDAMRLVAWLFRRAANDGLYLSWSGTAVLISVTGGVVATVGAAWLVKVLSPPQCAWWGWTLTIGGAAAFTAVAAWW